MGKGCFGSDIPLSPPIPTSPFLHFALLIVGRVPACDGLVFVVEDFEDGQELGHRERVVDPLVGVQDLQMAKLLPIFEVFDNEDQAVVRRELQRSYPQ